MNDDGDLKMSPEQHDSADGSRRPVCNSEPKEEDDGRVPVQITSHGASNSDATLLLPRAILDGFSASKKEALPRMLKQFITSHAFRSTIIYELAPQSKATMDVNIDSDSETSSSTSWQSTESSEAGYEKRKPYCFTFMELPAQLRIMVARYVLHVSDGLSWVWTNYREGPRTATIKFNPDYNRRLSLQKTTAIAQTCKTIYQENSRLGDRP
ncbi:hypothetical protein HBI06_134290 [Parastagonospora nodorum]|nr:hypothetical protein HBI06_134290 [Parastagonospora nodorum]KAH4233880.1 hypothetical protein HBI05_164250 [Parastagonospora nodorum]KAH5451589.1 hypothetical protein HBI30_127560 [Parastagonospora nodorum]KAH6304884.1 hypothetical protein HBI39_111610 [Parastagonospora nodorum]